MRPENGKNHLTGEGGAAPENADAARKAAEEAGEEVNPDPHFYKTLSHLNYENPRGSTLGYAKFAVVQALANALNVNPDQLVNYGTAVLVDKE